MRLMDQGTQKRCMLYSLAMCLDVDVEYLAKQIGYNGDEPFFRTQNDEQRSHHPQECIDAALDHGYAVVNVEPNPHQGNNSDEIEPIWNQTICQLRFRTYLRKYNGMVHMCLDSGELHMCAWCKDDQMVYDPNGRKYTIDAVNHLIGFYALISIK